MLVLQNKRIEVIHDGLMRGLDDKLLDFDNALAVLNRQVELGEPLLSQGRVETVLAAQLVICCLGVLIVHTLVIPLRVSGVLYH